MADIRRKWTKEQKADAVQRLREKSITLTELAKEMKISTGLLCNWRNEAEGKVMGKKRKVAKRKVAKSNPLPHVTSDAVVYLQLAKEAMIPGKLTRADLFSLIALSLIENGE